MNIVEGIARRALMHPERPAVIAGGQPLSYQRLLGASRRMAAALARQGIGRGDVVGVGPPGVAQHVTLTLAIAHLGAVSVPVADEETIAAAQRCGMKLLVRRQRDEPLQRTGPEVPVLTPAQLRSQAGAPVPPMAGVDPQSPWRIATSSGTTGQPGAIGFTHGNALLKVHMMRSLADPGADERMLLGIGLTLSLATDHWLRCLHYGGTLIEPADLSPEGLASTLREAGVTLLAASHNTAFALSEFARRPDSGFDRPLPALRGISLGGAAVAPALVQALRTHLCPEVGNTYGATEVGALAQADANMMLGDPGCAGRLLPWAEVQALDDQGEPLPAGQSGLLRMRSPLLSSGYVDGPRAGALPFREGWFHSSDRGSVTADGRLYVAQEIPPAPPGAPQRGDRSGE